MRSATDDGIHYPQGTEHVRIGRRELTQPGQLQEARVDDATLVNRWQAAVPQVVGSAVSGWPVTDSRMK
jgi:hypothetical protein